jgi:hypothetical protein
MNSSGIKYWDWHPILDYLTLSKEAEIMDF